MEYEIALNILSGLPNPTWRLGENECGQLAKMLEGLPRAKTGQLPSPPDLGYRGLTIRPNGNPNELTSMQVFEGLVTADSATYIDAGRKLEKWLTETGKPYVINQSLWNHAMNAIRDQ